MRTISCLAVLLLLAVGAASSVTMPVYAQRTDESTTVITSMKKGDLQNKLGTSVEITELGRDRETGDTVYQVRGDTEEVASKLAGDRSVRHVRSHPDFTKQQLAVMEPLLTSMITLEGHRLFGASVVRPHPFPKNPALCWVCKPCVEPEPPPLMPPGLLPDCPKPDNLDDLYDEWAKWAAMTQVLTDLLDAYNLYDYWSGVGNMVKDMVSAAGLLLPGAGSVLAKGLNMLLQMAADGLLNAAMDELLDATGLSDFNSRGAIEKALSEANSRRVAAHQAYMAVLIPWIECQNNVNEENIERQADLDAWNNVKDQYLKDWETYQDCLNDPNRCQQEECR